MLAWPLATFFSPKVRRSACSSSSTITSRGIGATTRGTNARELLGSMRIGGGGGGGGGRAEVGVISDISVPEDLEGGSRGGGGGAGGAEAVVETNKCIISDG
eukprot:scaffold223356_cov26-Tisochrysis_lutea.AAC.1